MDKEEQVNIGIFSCDTQDSGRNPQEIILICFGGGMEKVMVYSKQNRDARIAMERKRSGDSKKEHID